jgi:hypothetical protein
MKRARGISAAAWFYGQSFHNHREKELEKEAQRNADFYSGSSEEVFKNFDPNTGLRIRPDQGETGEEGK